jgi:heme-degrading monooxygenase HmoA
MISRQWRGLAKADQAQNYVKHLREDTFPALRTLPGFVSASILSRDVAGGVEFLIITQWRALDDIAGFSGPDLDAAVVPPAVAQLMIEYDHRVRHYAIIE